MSYDEAGDNVYRFYSLAEHLGKLAECANIAMQQNDRAEALACLEQAKSKYGDLLSLRMRMDDAIQALKENQ